MKISCSLLLVGCLLSSCTAQQRVASQPVQPQWTKTEIIGLSIELIDRLTVETLTFTPDGLVPLTVGQKKGYVTGPLFYWEFVSGRLRITTDGEQLYDEFALVARDASTITVHRHNGKIAKFKILRK